MFVKTGGGNTLVWSLCKGNGVFANHGDERTKFAPLARYREDVLCPVVSFCVEDAFGRLYVGSAGSCIESFDALVRGVVPLLVGWISRRVVGFPVFLKQQLETGLFSRGACKECILNLDACSTCIEYLTSAMSYNRWSVKVGGVCAWSCSELSYAGPCFACKAGL